MRVCTYEGGAVDPKLFTRSNIRELCLGYKGQYDPYDIEVMSNHEVCLTFKKEFPERVPQEDHERMLTDCFFYGIKAEMRNSIRHLYDSEKVTCGELLLKARRNEDEEMLAKVTSKSSVMETEVKGDLEEKVDKLLAVAKSGQMGNGKDKRDRSRTPKSTPTNSRQGTPTKRDNVPDIRNSLQGPAVNASGPFENEQKPI